MISIHILCSVCHSDEQNTLAKKTHTTTNTHQQVSASLQFTMSKTSLCFKTYGPVHSSPTWQPGIGQYLATKQL